MKPQDDQLIRRMNDLSHVFRGAWVSTVLIMLRDGRRQYRELRDEVSGWSFRDPWTGKQRSLNNSELARTLARMVDDGLLVRTEQQAQWQPAVFYELSAEAREMLAAVQPLLDWARTHRDFFSAAQFGRRDPATG